MKFSADMSVKRGIKERSIFETISHPLVSVWMCIKEPVRNRLRDSRLSLYFLEMVPCSDNFDLVVTVQRMKKTK
jgi:hypothetical protein